MNRATTVLLALLALVAGAATGEFLSRTALAHRWIGRLLGRGELVALLRNRGIFDSDMIADEVLRYWDANVRLNKGELDRVMFALRGEFGSEKNFSGALRANRIWGWQLREMVTDVFRGEEWIEEKIASHTSGSRAETQRYFDQHPAEFALPLRLRPRHIFLAAPEGSEIIETKRAAMQEIMTRLQAGEDFASLAAAVSEDEATKSRGGDLGFLSSDRVPAEFWSAIENLPVNGQPTLVQSHLGFHAVQILEARPGRMMTLEEARPEIEQLLAAEKRRVAVRQVREELARQARLVLR
jgi:hypothetical protein